MPEQLPDWAINDLDKLKHDQETWPDTSDKQGAIEHRENAIQQVLRDCGRPPKERSDAMMSVLRSVHEEATKIKDFRTGGDRKPDANINHVTKRFAGIVVLAAASADDAAQSLTLWTKWLFGFTALLLVFTGVLIGYTVALWKIAENTDNATGTTNATLAKIETDIQHLNARPGQQGGVVHPNRARVGAGSRG